MSGHSKWSQIKRQKGANDVKRGAVFTKMGREISVAARAGGGDPDGNFRLRLAIERARAMNMPLDTIKRAIEKATGGGEGEQFEEITYEGYGPGGVAILVETATDNKNRTAADVRSVLTKAGGQLAAPGSVAWQFEQRGVITLAPGGNTEELELLAIDAGADDVDSSGEQVEVYTRPHDLEAVRRELEAAGVKIESAELSMTPKNTVELDESKARQALRLVELLEDHDDVQRVTANFEIPEVDARRGRRVIILGIDPGTAMLGYGVIERTGPRLRAIDFGVISTPSTLTLPERLESIYLALTDLIELHAPVDGRRRAAVLHQERPDGLRRRAGQGSRAARRRSARSGSPRGHAQRGEGGHCRPRWRRQGAGRAHGPGHPRPGRDADSR